jgi:hypothetical protein
MLSFCGELPAYNQVTLLFNIKESEKLDNDYVLENFDRPIEDNNSQLN